MGISQLATNAVADASDIYFAAIKAHPSEDHGTIAIIAQTAAAGLNTTRIVTAIEQLIKTVR